MDLIDYGLKPPATLEVSAPSPSAKASQSTKVSPATAAPIELVFEDLWVGQCWTSHYRSITAADVASFGALTGDRDPLHQPSSRSNTSPFGQPIVHGLLAMSVLAGLSSTCPRVKTLALVGIEDWSFVRPVTFGQSVAAVTEVQSLRPHGRRAGRVHWHRRLIDSQRRTLQQGCFISLVATAGR